MVVEHNEVCGKSRDLRCYLYLVCMAARRIEGKRPSLADSSSTGRRSWHRGVKDHRAEYVAGLRDKYSRGDAVRLPRLRWDDRTGNRRVNTQRWAHVAKRRRYGWASGPQRRPATLMTWQCTSFENDVVLASILSVHRSESDIIQSTSSRPHGRHEIWL